MRLPSRSSLSLLTFALVVACVPGPRAPDVSATRSLELADETRSKASARPFGVVSAAPQGEARGESEVAVVLNRPLHGLETAGEESPVPARIEAVGTGKAPPGLWQWMGSQAFVFVPEGKGLAGGGGALALATTYRVIVPAGTRALDGATLTADYTFSFSTARPAVRLADSADLRALAPLPKLRLLANQPLDAREIERTTRFVAKSGKATSIAVRALAVPSPPQGAASRAAAGAPAERLQDAFDIVPVTPLPLATDFALRVAAGLRGKEGPLRSTEEASFDISTYGPLRVAEISCSEADDGSQRCAPGGGVHIALTNPVAWKDLRAAVTVSGRPIPSSEYGDGEQASTRSIWVPGPFPAGGSIVASVRAGIKDEYGQSLQAGASKAFRIGDLPSRLEVGVQGQVFERRPGSVARTVPVRSINLDAYTLGLASLSEEQAVLAAGHARHGGSQRAFEYLQAVGREKMRTVRPQTGKNRPALESISLDGVLGRPNAAGVVALFTEVREPRKNRAQDFLRHDTSLYRVTDLAISAKLSRYGGVIWVTRLSDAAPVPAASIRLRSADDARVLFQGSADSAGMLTVPPGDYFRGDGNGNGMTVVVAAAGDDWTYRELDDPSNQNIWPDTSRELSTIGMLFTDRGLYRRGEAVHVKALFREEQLQGLQTPSGKTVRLTATDADGSVVFERASKLGAFGEAAFEVPVRDGAPLGALSLRAHLEGREQAGSAYESVQVAAYRPAEFKTSTAFAKPAHVRGDKASCSARGEYLFGAPLTQGSARFTLSRRSTWFSPPGQEDRIVDDTTFGRDGDASASGYSIISAASDNDAQDAGERALGPRGEASFELPLRMPAQIGPESVTCEADITDISRQSIAAESTTLVHPASFYLALDTPDDSFVGERTKLQPKLRAVDPEGRARGNVPAEIELIKRSWSSVYEEQGAGGGRYTTHVKDVAVARCDVRTPAAGAVGCPLQVEGPGYYVVHAKSRDERNNPIGASYGIYVSGEGGSAGWAVRDDASLELVTDKRSYEVGQTAKLLVKNPFFEADALVTVERANVLQQFRVHVKGPAPVIEIPIAAEVRPNAFVTVELVRGRIRDAALPPPAPAPQKAGAIRKRAARGAEARAVDLGGPAYRIGTATLSVEPASRRLVAKVKTPRTQYGPGEQLDADIDVRDAAGKGVEADVTFYVVDEGVLMLSGYKTPDPVPRFSAGLPLRVGTFETRDQLAKLLKFRPVIGEDKGLEGGGGGDVRSDFRTTAVFTSVRSDAQGRAHVRTKLPDGLTTYRLMAVVAGKDDRFGFGESRIVTSRPLMVRPALPRFVRAGDRIDAGAIVTTKGLPAGTVAVSMTVTGAALEGPGTRSIPIPKDGSAEVRFALRFDQVGPVQITLRAEGLGAKDAATLKKQVQIPSVYETVALSGETDKAVAERLGNLDAIRTDAGGLDVRLASTALVGVESVVDQLVEYPHGCTEQIASRLLPLVESQQLAGFFGIQIPGKPERLADAAIAQMLERQHADGGFGYWGSSTQSDPWLSTYAAFVLGRARAAGRPVPNAALDRAYSYVRASLRDGQRRASWTERAFAVDMLASLGQVAAPAGPAIGKKGGQPPTEGIAGAIHALLPPPADAPLFARALLAHALAAAKLRKEDQLELARDLERSVRLTPSGAIVAEAASESDRMLRRRLLDSDRRTMAMVLRALVAIDPVHPLAPKLAKGLLGARRNGQYQSTQEAAWVLLALDDYRQAYERVAPSFDARLFLGGSLAREAGFRGGTARAQSVELAMDKLFAGSGRSDAPLAFQVVGNGTLFYEARLRYARKSNPTTPLSRGFSVQRWLRAVEPSNLEGATRSLPSASETSVAAGSLVLIDVLVVNDAPAYQVVLDDPLPAGLEAVNGDLLGTAQSLGGALARAESEDEREGEDDDYRWRSGWRGYERKTDDDRVLTYVEDLPAGLHHYRYLARATTRGQFVVPPARVECMYEPEIFGRTAGATFTVR